MRRARSIPAVMLPHWSLPPTCNWQPKLLVQMNKVVRLQQHIAELGVADAAFAFQADLSQNPWPASRSPENAYRRRAESRDS